MPLIYFGVAYGYLIEQEKRDVVGKIVFWNCLIQAIIGIVHHYFFAYILTGSSDYVGLDGSSYKIVEPGEGGQREPGTLLSSSLYANFILIGEFLLASSYRTWRFPKILEYTFLLVLVWGILLAGSRWPSCGAMLFLFLYFKRDRPLKKMAFIPIIMLAGFYSQGHILGIITRIVKEGMSARLPKISLALGTIFENITSFLLGPSFHTGDMRVNGIGFSDNSFLSLAMVFGVPLTFLSLLFFIYVIKRTMVVQENWIILAYVIGTLFVVNSIYWDMWIFYLFVALFCVQPASKFRPAGIVYPKPMVQIRQN